MKLSRIRITTMALVGHVGLWLALFAGCHASKSEVRAARNSGYDADFAIVYRETLAAVRKHYPQFSENASAGVIRTSWHPIRINTEQADLPSTQQASRTMGAGQYGRDMFYIRFDVFVVGGNPWRVRVEGHASEWRRDSVPAEMHGANTPHWLKGRTEALEVEIHRRLKKYAVKLPSTAKVEETPEQPAPEVDMSRLGKFPADAAKTMAAVLGAARSRDFQALRRLMSPDFTWNLGAPPSADQALIMWQADTTLLETLAAVIQAGCRTEPGQKRVVCPAEYTGQPGYAGHRAGFEPGPGGQWKMIYFVSGE